MLQALDKLHDQHLLSLVGSCHVGCLVFLYQRINAHFLPYLPQLMQWLLAVMQQNAGLDSCCSL